VETNVFSFDGSHELDNFVAFGPFNRRMEEIGNLKAILCVYEGVESSVDIEETFKVIEDLTDYYSEAFKPLDRTVLLWVVVSSPIEGGGVREDSFLLSAVRMGTSFWDKLAHEYAHLWNGKGLRTQEARWFNEGATVFLTYKALVDVGAISEGLRNDKLLRDWQTYLDLRTSGEDKAVSAGSIGYVSIIYTKGHLVTNALDLFIRDATEGSKDFLDLARYLATNYWGTSVSNDDLLSAVNHVTGADFSDFFSKYVYGTEKLPLQVVGGTLVLKK
jgi:predicted metalloprotease with PDZ domain